MKDNSNQFSYSVNLQDNIRKNSEIPTIGKHVNNIRKNSLSDDEDMEYHNPHATTNPLQQAVEQNWKIENVRGTTTMFDVRHIASKQIAQQISRPIPYTTILLVILAVFISGFKGTAFLLIDLSDPEDESQSGGFILRAFWRQIMITLFFLPLVYQEYYKEKKEEIDEMRLYQAEFIFNKGSIKIILFCSFTYAIWVGTMAYSVFHTSMANVYIFNNIYPLFLVIAKFFPSSWFSKSKDEQAESQSTNNLERVGALLAIVVLVLLASEDTSVVTAEMIALVGALAASIYYSNLQHLVFEYPWMLAVFLLSGFTAVFFGLYSYLFEKSTLDMDTRHGLFGVFSVEWILIHIIISLLTGVVNTKLFSYISQQIKTMYVDIAIMSEAFAALFLAFLFGYQQLPNLTQCAIYFFYVIALVMLAVGKSEAQIEQISLNDDNNLRVTTLVNGFSNSNVSTNKHLGQLSNNRGSYLPPSQFATPSNKYHQSMMSIQKKNTISQVSDMSMTDFSKLNFQNQRTNSTLDLQNEQIKNINMNNLSSSSNTINSNQNKYNNSYNLQSSESDNKLPSNYNTPSDNANYHTLQNSHINVIIEQDEDMNDSRYIPPTLHDNNNNNNHNINNNRPHTLNDSINNFNNEFIKNLKKKEFN